MQLVEPEAFRDLTGAIDDLPSLGLVFPVEVVAFSRCADDVPRDRRFAHLPRTREQQHVAFLHEVPLELLRQISVHDKIRIYRKNVMTVLR